MKINEVRKGNFNEALRLLEDRDRRRPGNRRILRELNECRERMG